MELQVTISNLPAIRRAFEQAPRLMGKHFRTAMTKAVVSVQRESMLRTPVDTGRLRASHTFNVSGEGLGITGTVEPTANYAIFVHEGTRFMRARPFLKEGASAAQDDIEKYFRDAMQDTFDDIGRSV